MLSALPPESPPAAATVRLVAAGDDHACAIRDGNLFCWGLNAKGQAGGSAAAQLTPNRLGVGSRWQEVAAGSGSSCALRGDGQVWCWGDNAFGQLGTADLIAGPLPRQVLLAKGAKSLSLKFNHACAVLDDGSLWCWGDNFEGQLGLGDFPPGQPEPSPKQPSIAGRSWVSVATGQGHTCAIASDRSLWCWGRNTDSELGIGAVPGQMRTPVQVGVAADWVQVAAGQSSTCGIRGNGELWCWGRSIEAGLGTGVSEETIQFPKQIGTAADFVRVAVNTFHSCALRRNSEGNLWCWGRRQEGQLGEALPTPRLVPELFDGNLTWQSVALGRFFTCAWRTDGLFCTGENNQGQLGLGDTSRRQAATLLSVPEP